MGGAGLYEKKTTFCGVTRRETIGDEEEDEQEINLLIALAQRSIAFS
jgi:hypothetical protein